MAYGILLLGVVVGAIAVGHGTQKLFGCFGGPGLGVTSGYFGSLGFRPGRAMAPFAGLSECSGAPLVLGLATPLGAVAFATVMVVAVGSVHWKNGFWVTNGGLEYNLALWSVTVALAT